MNLRNLPLTLAVFILTVGIASATVTIDLVAVGNTGNLPDTTGIPKSCGAVGYNYKIGKYEVTAGQYTDFLNAVASTSDSYGLYDFYMATTTYGSKIIKNGGTYTASLPNEPANYISWCDAARFCNWLQNGQQTYAQDPLTTEKGGYTLNGYTDNAHLMAVTRNPGFQFYIPTMDEWYKAAYYDPNKGGTGIGGYWLYPTKSDIAHPPTNVYPSASTNNANYKNGSIYTLGVSPYTTEVGSFTNSQSAYGTLDQGGNVWEWNEDATGGSWRAVRGGAFDVAKDSMSTNNLSGLAASNDVWAPNIGFRVVYVPEPDSLVMLFTIAVCGLMYWKCRNG
jgi:formylglycine-generating enzyme required for sulfatase activity